MPASESPKLKEIYEFGHFRLDPEKELLQRDGKSIRLQPKTFQTLLVLIRHNQEVVTKDDLMKAVWPDTFVEEANLSRNIFMLRKALGGSSQDHQYILTVPGRGYRLAESVRLVPEREVSIVAAQHSKVQIQVKDSKSWVWITVSAIVVVAVAMGAVLIFTHRTPLLTAKDTVVLADFANLTGDPVFDGTLQRGLTIQLEQSPFLGIASDQQIQQTLRMMGQKPDVKLTPEIARELCQRTASTAVLNGSIAQIGTRYLLTLRAVNCANEESLASAEAQASDKNHVLDTLGRMASEIRGKLGEAFSSVREFDTPLEQATTPSLEALQAYSLGRKTFYEKGNAAALPFLKRAVELDPDFALAYRALAATYGNLSEPTLQAEYSRRAYELRYKVSERERFFIEASYYFMGTEQMEKALPVYALWQRRYPRDYSLYGHLAVLYKMLGDLDKSLDNARESVRLEPNRVDNDEGVIAAYINLDRLDEAEVALKQTEQRSLESEGLLWLRYRLAFLEGDAARATQTLSDAMGKPGAEDWLLKGHSDTEAWHGRFHSARALTRRAMDSAERNDAKELSATYQAEAALLEAEAGNREQARADASAAVKLAVNQNVLATAALAVARTGDIAMAEKLAAELDRTYPLNTLIQRYRLPTIRAAIALKRMDPNQAVRLLAVTSPIELGDEGQLLPVYLRGQAYLMLQDGNRAAQEFEKFAAHRGLVGNFPLGALAGLDLGRAHALSGNKEKAQAAYQGFFTLWKDADSDIPILKQARTEYAKLQ